MIGFHRIVNPAFFLRTAGPNYVMILINCWVVVDKLKVWVVFSSFFIIIPVLACFCCSAKYGFASQNWRLVSLRLSCFVEYFFG